MNHLDLTEALEQKKFTQGQVNFSSSTLQDKFVQQMIQRIAKAANVLPQQVEAKVQQDIAQLQAKAKMAPTLYHTIVKNAAEDAVFSLFWKTDVPVNGPKFNAVLFNKLVRSIRADHDEFLPLRGFLDVRRVANPEYIFVDKDTKGEMAQITTAAATPSGKFIFNIPFMQKLMDWGTLKGIKASGKKYESNGGDIPDVYSYIEFLIMHEFMHYSNDDFYYQQIIPNADPTIINWVGDFRSNYLLVKSGYQQLPIGLYNDLINYDRQKAYVEMYNLVKAEFDKLPKQEQQNIKGDLDGRTDSHEKGQAEGAQADVEKDGQRPTPGDIDKNQGRIEREMAGKEDSAPDDRKKGEPSPGQGEGKKGGPGAGQNARIGVDYSKIKPVFNWKALIKRFIQTSTPKTEETYAKPARKGVTNIVIARQKGAAAIKPAEKPLEYAESKLGFCFDSSGSMSGVIAKAYANAYQLLKHPMFRKTECLVWKFSASHELYKVNFAGNKAAKVATIKDKPKNWNLKTTQVFSEHYGSSTNFSPALANDIIAALKQKRNVIFFLDGDILAGSNLANFVSILKTAPKQVFVIFDARNTYVQFRQQTGISTPGLTYFS